MSWKVYFDCEIELVMEEMVDVNFSLFSIQMDCILFFLSVLLLLLVGLVSEWVIILYSIQ